MCPAVPPAPDSPPAVRFPPWLHHAARLLSLGLLALLAAGCQTYTTRTEGSRAAWRSGQFETAAREFSQRADRSGSGRDGVLWRLEQGTAQRAAGQIEQSNRAFDQAEQRMAEYAARARVRVGNEAMAALTTPANLPYEGRAYDRIMAATYRALNALNLGQPDVARPALIRAYQYQQDAVAENARRIERAREEAAQSPQSATVQRTQNDPRFQSQIQEVFSPVAALQPYAEYVNPFTVWLDGIFFAAQAQDASDLERARFSLQRATQFAPDNPHLRADLEAIDRRFQGALPDPITYVIFETGLAPIREQVRFDIPIIFANVSYVGSAWPVLQPQSGHALTLAVQAGNQRILTSTVASMDRVIARDFENSKPEIITRTLVATIAKGAAAFVANEAAYQQDAGLGALVRIATMAYQASVNIADTRTWTTLPKEFQIARLPTPADRRLTLQEGSLPPVPVDIEEGTVNLVYVKSVLGNTPLHISQSRLR
jgi:hypothetical protein